VVRVALGEVNVHDSAPSQGATTHQDLAGEMSGPDGVVTVS